MANVYAMLAPSSDQNRKFAELARNGALTAHPYFLSRTLFTAQQQRNLQPTLKANSAAMLRAKQPMLDSMTIARELDPVNRVSYLESRCYMLNMLLRDSDCMSMAHGLEVRVPLIDSQLARRILALPGSWKLDEIMPKPLLVRALAGQLPEKIIHRPKRGFTLPFEHWLRNALHSAAEASFDRIHDGPLAEMIDAPAAQRVWKDFMQGKTSWSRPWALFVLQSWCEHHLQAGPRTTAVF